MRDDCQPPLVAVRSAVALALAEDLLPLGDLTAALVPKNLVSVGQIVSRGQGIVAGMACVVEAFAQVDASVVVNLKCNDGDQISIGGVIAEVKGPLRSILNAERTALNFVSHLSGIATLANQFVRRAAVGNGATRVWDTRKTTPGLRSLEKAAVRAGGAWNHRGSLSEAVLVKDNHLGGLSITQAVDMAKKRWPARMIEVECDTLDQVNEAVVAGATLIMCDNMTPVQVKEAVQLVKSHPAGRAGAVLVEASGGIDLSTVAEFAAAGADLVSVGAITNSAPVLDFGLDLVDPGQNDTMAFPS